MYRIQASLCIGEYADHVYKALLAEARQPAPHKGRVLFKLMDGCLVLDIESETLSGLRALTSSFLYLVHAAYSSIREAEGHAL